MSIAEEVKYVRDLDTPFPCMGMGRLSGLSLAINTGRPPYPGERARLQGVIMILLPWGYPRFNFSACGI